MCVCVCMCVSEEFQNDLICLQISCPFSYLCNRFKYHLKNILLYNIYQG